MNALNTPRAITRNDVLKSARLAGGVKRYHTWPVLREQRVDSHTWQVMRIYVELFGAPRADVWVHLLYHDTGELHSGDTPSFAKASSPVLKAALDELEGKAREFMKVPTVGLTEQELIKCKICDAVERWEFAREEARLGNQYAAPVASGAWAQVEEIVRGQFPDDWEKISQWMLER